MNKFDQYYQEHGDYHVLAYERDMPFKKYIDSIVSFFDDKVGQSILNVGAGEGLEAELLLEKGHRVDIIDISQIAMQYTFDRLLHRGFEYRSINFVGDFTTIVFSQKYDWILIPNTLNWMDDQTELKAIEKIKEMAKIGAYITVADKARSPGMDLRDYTKERLLELFPNSTVYLQDEVRWVIIWKKE